MNTQTQIARRLAPTVLLKTDVFEGEKVYPSRCMKKGFFEGDGRRDRIYPFIRNEGVGRAFWS